VADIGAGGGAERRGGGRNRRRELLDRHLLAVVGDVAGIGAGQMVEEETVLQTARAMQADLAEALAQSLHPALQLGALGGAHRDAEVGAQHRRVRGGLQDRLVLARQLAVLLSLPARPGLGPFGLLAPGVLSIEDALSHMSQRLAVADPTRVQHGISGKARVFEGREKELGVARELSLLGQ
jgi:hypothetical protein